MRTTLDLPLDLLEEARHVLGFKSKTDTVVLALRELVRRRRIDDLKALLGHVELEVDLPRSRRRPARGRSWS
jgi:Arc/MetJ family transcription regulator